MASIQLNLLESSPPPPPGDVDGEELLLLDLEDEGELEEKVGVFQAGVPNAVLILKSCGCKVSVKQK